MLKRKQAKKIANYFEKLVIRIETAEPKKETIILNIGKAEMFVKALKLAEAIDTFTAEEMKAAILEAEQEVYKKI